LEKLPKNRPRRCPNCGAYKTGRDSNQKRYCPTCGWAEAGHKRDRKKKKKK
jgi:hypothetical protein